MAKAVVLLSSLLFQCILGDYFDPFSSQNKTKQKNNNRLPRITCKSKTHYDFGYCLGQQTEMLIKERYNRSTHFQDLYAWVNTVNGSIILNEFLTNNYNKYPDYFEELYGISNGSNVDLTIVYVMTLDDELSYFYPNDSNVNTTNDNNNNNNNNEIIMQGIQYSNYKHPMACSDYLLHNYAPRTPTSKYHKLIDYSMAHNEDNIPECRNVTYVVDAAIEGGLSFVTYSYAGELPTQAFGYNDYIVFTSNYVHPANPVVGGIGRNFVGRNLLDTTNLQEAMDVVAQDGQCGGHNYQIAEWTTGNMTGAEVAYDGLHAFTLITPSYNWTFHANRYIHLNISQVEDEEKVFVDLYNFFFWGHFFFLIKKKLTSWYSSEHREERAAELGRPNGLSDMLNDLGDTEDEEYPIYKYGPSDYTLHTFGVELKNCSWTIFGDNPKLRHVIYQGSVQCKTPITH
ncbi:hypothetical protein RFI_35680 [Reticulomyxa filosa]|uniref:Peptidase C45 hydrolase domain-containing protein n=1 Tax=Reticulomyxa filosa TaxID=46433 RepID=X6LLZ7_RETFI|nr:hypothetical protein RFI_35680 [Reticulomyxa filosa]|eukprot:ETO01760.1 hypothetical protein RFI_35680 [Reticulomyxa filosa]